MKTQHIKLVRKQLDATLKQFKPFCNVVPPVKGWIRAIRDAIGMTGSQLAARLNVNKQRVARIEQDEQLGKLTVNTLRNTAEALDCKFVYGFVPHESLEQTVRHQASKVAEKRMARSNQTMRLENQELGDKEKQKAMKDLIEEIIATMPRSLWDE